MYLPDIESTANAALQLALQSAIDSKTKPLGALGELESLALQLGLIQQSARPQLAQPQVVVFAADHGLAAEGVSAYPSSVTAQMVANMLAGGAAVNVFAAQMGFSMSLVNAGVASPVAAPATETSPAWINKPIAPGTANSLHGPAMTSAQLEQAMRLGADIATQLPGNVVAFGEMGIGNTSAASLIACQLLGMDVNAATGRGTGVNDAQLAHKRQMLASVLARHAQGDPPPWTSELAPKAGQAAWAMQSMGGLEMAAMAGAMLGAASVRKVVLVDGVIAGAAALVAANLRPAALPYMVCAHQSAEPAGALLLRALGKRPLLQLGMRLGEGTGALLAYPLLQAACQFLQHMASFEQAQVAGPVA